MDGVNFTLLKSEDSFWRESNQMGVLNTDVAKQLGAKTLGARFWRLKPGQASTRHRHREAAELYLLLEGLGKIRIDGQLVEMQRMDTLLVEPAANRQIFNDTDADQLWYIVGAPVELANTLDMSEEDLAWHYPDGPKAMPEELS